MNSLDRVGALLKRPSAYDTSRGYLDLLGGDSGAAYPTLAQRLMRSSALPKVYEDLWRPVLFGLAKGGPFGPNTEEEYALARERLGLAGVPGGTVLDVGCGPGNVTRALASGMTGHGLVVGADASATMLAQAVASTAKPSHRGQNGSADVAYVRCDALDLPFRDAVFDAACCFGALYLFEDPWAAIDGIARVLKPGGRLVLLTGRRPAVPLVGAGSQVLGRLTGVRVFAVGEVRAALLERGFADVGQRSYGLMELVSGTLA